MENKLNKYLKDILEDYFVSNMSTLKISKKYNCNVKTVLSLFRTNNIKLKNNSERHRKYEVDHNYFETIDREDKAYLLGLLYADGYNNINKGYITLSLNTKDKSILDYFKNVIQPEKPLEFNKASNYTCSDNYRLVIYSRKMSKDLEKLGCMNNKTFKLKFPEESQVPNELLKHFVRGYFDGDGSINNGNRNHFSFVGTLNFINSLQEFFNKELNFNITKHSVRHPENNNDIVSLLKCGRGQCVKFGNWLYKDANVYFDRKRDIFVNKYNCTFM